ncbi:MAG: hypothetical protein K1X65_23745 [Caldilineales bacterium]|nr:hypothetical protein [Caldilineales bacterium]MCW5860678.1 hypothetical protein [Caldilineales bacterium]
MKATCPYCRNQWFLTPEALALAVEQSPANSKSIHVECPRCRKLIKLARPRRLPAAPAAPEPTPEPD